MGKNHETNACGCNHTDRVYMLLKIEQFLIQIRKKLNCTNTRISCESVHCFVVNLSVVTSLNTITA